jgi:hypothetical protein
MTARLPMHDRTRAFTLQDADNGAAREQLLMQTSLARLRDEFKRYRDRLAPPRLSLASDLFNSPPASHHAAPHLTQE